ncbi:nucleotide exchange factor GrpE [Actinokineospora cianjurensis]|uniref:nucleotide exchange factor GrpE n=1 Tax=Actinokineospora cianjurensis TaxID=585224 RepID=UPI000EAF1C1C|nr:nucleotide exchange factor GrpE [Actinokineospora cianjurensis]
MTRVLVCLIASLLLLAPPAHAQTTAVPVPAEGGARVTTGTSSAQPVVPGSSVAEDGVQPSMTPQPGAPQVEPAAWWSGWVLPALIGLLVVVAALVLALSRRRSRVPVAEFGSAAPVPVVVDDGAGLAPVLRLVGDNAPGDAIRQQVTRLLAGAPDRAALVDCAIRLRDQLGDRAPDLAHRLLSALNATGITEITADGALFDPHHHTAAGTVEAPRPDFRDRVAETRKPGYLDHGTVLRLPEVILYR